MTKDEQIKRLDEINKELLRMVLEQSRHIRAMEEAMKEKRVNYEFDTEQSDG